MCIVVGYLDEEAEFVWELDREHHWPSCHGGDMLHSSDGDGRQDRSRDPGESPMIDECHDEYQVAFF